MDLQNVIFVSTVGAAPGGGGFSILQLVAQADIVVQLVLFGLIGMSIACWGIILNKWGVVNRAYSQSASFIDAFWKAPDLDQIYQKTGRYPQSPVAEVFKAGYAELGRLTASGGAGAMDLGLTENIERALRRTTNTELAQLERLIPFLATTGSTAPFIGLFGTVWGILRAFQKIGETGQASIQTVGPDISHALVATAVGLLVAIPSVALFNFFKGMLKERVSNTEFLSRIVLASANRREEGK